MRFLAVLLALVLLAPAAQAHQFTLDDLVVRHPWVRATIGNLRNTAGYMTVENRGATTQRLLAVEIEGAQAVEMHEMKDGAMARVEGLDIAPGETVIFQPDSWHLMVGPLAGPLAEGGEVAGALVFEPAGRLPVVFKIDAANATESHDHQ